MIWALFWAKGIGEGNIWAERGTDAFEPAALLPGRAASVFVALTTTNELREMPRSVEAPRCVGHPDRSEYRGFAAMAQQALSE